MAKVSRFTSKAVTLVQDVVGGRGEVATHEGGGGFANYAPGSLHCLRVYLDESYRDAFDSLSEMPHIFGEIYLEAGDLPAHAYLFIS